MGEHVMKIGDKEFRASVTEMSSGRAKVVVDSVEYDVELVTIGRRQVAPQDAVPRPAVPIQPATTPQAPTSSVRAPQRPTPMLAGQGSVVAPMPGAIFQMRVKEGDRVTAGQVLIVMEAMKMESPVNAPFNGTVSKVFVREGDNVGEGDPLVELSRPEMTTM